MDMDYILYTDLGSALGCNPEPLDLYLSQPAPSTPCLKFDPADIASHQTCLGRT